MKKYFAILLITLSITSALVTSNPSYATLNDFTITLHPAGDAIQDKKVVIPIITTRSVLPASVDLRSWAMPVADQGMVGSCVTWAINYGMMGWYSRYQHISISGIAFAPMYVYSQIHIDNTEYGGGSYPEDAYNIATTQGVDTQVHYQPQGNYNWLDKPTAAETVSAAQHKSQSMITMYNVAPGINTGDASSIAIKTELAKFHPVALTIPVYKAFDYLTSVHYSLDSSQVDVSTFRGNHEVLALGYDSNGVLIQNSWGVDWANKGYAYLTWKFVNQYVEEATTMAGLQPSPVVVGSPRKLSVVIHKSIHSVTLHWLQPTVSDGVMITGYKVQRNGTNASSKVLSANSRFATFTKLKPGFTYTFTVQTITTKGVSKQTIISVKM